MSDLEALAAQVRALANEAHQAASFAARQQRDVSNLAQRVASAASGSNDGSLRSVLALVETAARALGQCASQLDTTAQHGKRYAAFLVNGSTAGSDGDGPHEETEELDPSAMVENASEVAGGLAFFDSSDPTLRAALTLPAFPGTRKYDLHGSSQSVVIGGRHLSPAEFALVVRADPEWNGAPVTLFSCDTGKQPASGVPFAQELADALGVTVTAPTELAWSNGAPFSASGWLDRWGETRPTIPPDGEFKEFLPTESERTA